MIVYYGRNHGYPGQVTSGGTSEFKLGEEVRKVLEGKCAEAGWSLEHVTGRTIDQANQIKARVGLLPAKEKWVCLQVHMNAGGEYGTDLMTRSNDWLGGQLAGIMMGMFESTSMPMPAKRVWRLPNPKWEDPERPGEDVRFPNETFVYYAPAPVVLVEAGFASDQKFASWIDGAAQRKVLAGAIFAALAEWDKVNSEIQWPVEMPI